MRIGMRGLGGEELKDEMGRWRNGAKDTVIHPLVERNAYERNNE